MRRRKVHSQPTMPLLLCLTTNERSLGHNGTTTNRGWISHIRQRPFSAEQGMSIYRSNQSANQIFFKFSRTRWQSSPVGGALAPPPRSIGGCPAPTSYRFTLHHRHVLAAHSKSDLFASSRVCVQHKHPPSEQSALG